MSFKVTGENIYFRKLQEADLATLMSAVDFNVFEQVPLKLMVIIVRI